MLQTYMLFVSNYLKSGTGGSHGDSSTARYFDVKKNAVNISGTQNMGDIKIIIKKLTVKIVII